eukprot:m.49706 g.49706  ORF g.49706 m.49706 type:complete len:460 (-) comp21100_c0_seq1:34-1413(-)
MAPLKKITIVLSVFVVAMVAFRKPASKSVLTERGLQLSVTHGEHSSHISADSLKNVRRSHKLEHPAYRAERVPLASLLSKAFQGGNVNRATGPAFFRPLADKRRFCTLVPASAKPSYTPYLFEMAKTLFKDEKVMSYLLFNRDDKSEPSVDETVGLCQDLHDIGSNVRCHLTPVENCGIGRKCAARTMFTAMNVLGEEIVENCDFIIKLDPDCIFIPNAALQFVKGTSPERPVFYGTFSANLVFSGVPNLWVRTQMPKGNWMVSVATMRQMISVSKKDVCSPNGRYPATDEAAAVLCAYHSQACECVTNWRNFVRIGPAGGDASNLERHVTKIKSRPQEYDCIMLIHKFFLNETTTIYNHLQSLNHSNRTCGDEGTLLQRSESTDFNRPAVGGYKFPNKTAIMIHPDCINQQIPQNQEGVVRQVPDWIIAEGEAYQGLVGTAAAIAYVNYSEPVWNPQG